MGFRGLTNNNETWEILDFPTCFVHFVIILSKTNSKHNLLHLSINSYPTESGVHGPPFIPRAIHSTARFCQRCLPRVWRNPKIHHIQTCKKTVQMPECGLKKIHLKFLTWQNHRKTYPKYVWNLINPEHPGRSIIIQNDGMSLHDQAIQGDLQCIGLHWLYLSSTIFKFGKRHMYRTIWAVVVWSLAHTSGLISRTI